MSSFDERKNASERKFVMDADQEFKAAARRNKLLGLWVAKLLNKDDEAAKAYATSVVIADMEEAGDEDVFRKVKQDLIEGGQTLSDTEIRDRMNILMTEAEQQIMGEAG